MDKHHNPGKLAYSLNIIHHNLTEQRNSLSREANIDSILVLNKQIGEHEMSAIRLKRTRNSLLNISRLPPEVLGDIFRRNVTFEDTFGGLETRSHNFLLVCHHWFEVASRTPELWSFWGNNLEDWKKRYLRYPTAPLDLVLDGGELEGVTLCDTLQNALQDRAARDSIRRIHLVSEDSRLLDSIISPIVVNREGIRSSRLESVVIYEIGDTSIDISDFFTYHRFPKLQRLELGDCSISSWNLVASRTSALTTLTLGFSSPSPTPTASQLLSILSSNPSLREIILFTGGTPDDDGGGGGEFTSRIPLHHLKKLQLTGDSQNIFWLLHQLDYPANMDNLVINLVDLTVKVVSQTVGPYVRDYLQRRGKSHGWGVYLSSEGEIELRVGEVGGNNFSALESTQVDDFLEVTVQLDPIPPKRLLEEVILDFVAHVPQEEVVYLRLDRNPTATKEMSTKFPNISALRFERATLHVAFPNQPPDVDSEIFPSLQHLTLDEVAVRDSNWGPLTTFLAHRASSGNRIDTLEIFHRYHMRPEVEESIRGAVREFRMTDIDKDRIDESFSPS